jgi:hypothetical protein
MIYFGNPFHLPGPKDLGMSNSNTSMPWKHFSNTNEPDWDDYYAKLAELYPVKFFLTSTLPGLIRYTWLRWAGWKLRDAYWWVRYHTINKYHMLDLRQPDYKYGYLEPDTKMLYAMFNLLNEAVDTGHLYIPSEDEIQDAEDYERHALQCQRDEYLEVKAIHHWWNVERLEEHKAEKDLLDRWHTLFSIDRSSTEAKQLHEQLSEMETLHHQKEEEMTIRLMKVRRHLWS